jgi:DNA invertase Pin-like site-specific DNA recombinase
MEPPMSTEQPKPVAFIYDRHATPTKGILLLRLAACREYVEQEGYELAGEWVDDGHHALTDDNRPQFDAMHDALLAAHQAGRKVVCVVLDWDRISRDRWNLAIFARRITLAGGWVETIAGETTKPEDARRGLLTAAPGCLEMDA